MRVCARQVRYEAVEFVKYDDEPGVDIPDPDTEGVNASYVELWANMEAVDGRLDSATLLRGDWSMPELDLGAILVKSLAPPSPPPSLFLPLIAC